MAVGDTVFSPPTTDARLTIQFISLPTFHLEVRRILVFLIKLPSFLKQIFNIYHFLEEKHFYKKNLAVKNINILSCHFFSPPCICIFYISNMFILFKYLLKRIFFNKKNRPPLVICFLSETLLCLRLAWNVVFLFNLNFYQAFPFSKMEFQFIFCSILLRNEHSVINSCNYRFVSG